MKNLTLIIPAKNESESLPLVLAELDKFKCKKLIVLDKSDKKTINCVNKIYKVKFLYQKKRGYGAALIEGAKNCKTKFFCIFNADGSFNPNELVLMYKKIKKYDFVFGSRYQKNSGSDDDNIITFIGNFFFTKIGNILFKLPITDILYTFVMGKTSKVKSLGISSLDFSYCVELPIKIFRNKLSLTSISSYERIRIGGKKKVNAIIDGLKILNTMISLFFSK